jgi:DNA-binding CsgD family transcriptional regulator
LYAVSEQNVENDFEKGQLIKETHYVIQSLSARERTVLEECFFAGLSCPEVARKFGTKTSSIEKIRERAMKKLTHGIRGAKLIQWINEDEAYDVDSDSIEQARTYDSLEKEQRDRRKERRLEALAEAFAVGRAHVVSDLLRIKKEAEEALGESALQDIQSLLKNGERNLNRHLRSESLESERELFLLGCLDHKIGSERASALFWQLELDYARFSDWNEVLLAWAIDKGLNLQELFDLKAKVLEKAPLLKYSLPEKEFPVQERNTQTEKDNMTNEWVGKSKNDVAKNGLPIVVTQILERADWFHTVSLTKRNVLFNDVLGEYEIPDIASEQAFVGTEPKPAYRAFVALAEQYREALAVADARFDAIEELICFNQREKAILKSNFILIMGLQKLSLSYMNARLNECGFPPINEEFEFERIHTQHTR